MGALLVASARADFRVVGSDLLGLEFTKACYDFAGRNGLRLALACDGSRPGLEKLKTGRADLALLTLPLGEALDLAGFESVPLGYHCVAVVAPATCPLERITLEQLAVVFGAPASSTGAANAWHWGDLGVEGEWAARAVEAMAPEVGAGIALEYFRKAVLRGQRLKAGVQHYASSADLAAQVRAGSRFLALVSTIPADRTAVKVIPIATIAEISSSPIWPTPASVVAGDYPLRLPVMLVFSPERRAALAPVLRFLFSDDAAGALERVGLVPLPAELRAAQVRALEK